MPENLNPEIVKGVFASIVRWIIPLLLGLFGVDWSEDKIGKVATAMTVLCVGAISIWTSLREKKKLVLTCPACHGPVDEAGNCPLCTPLDRHQVVVAERQRAANLSLGEACGMGADGLEVVGGPAPAMKPGDPGYFCDQCPHAMALHNPDGSCPCGMDCATRRKAAKV